MAQLQTPKIIHTSRERTIQWTKIGVFSSIALICAVLGITILRQDSTGKAGIATLTFNFTENLPNLLIKPRDFPVSIIQSEAQSVASVLTTAVPAAASKVQSAAGNMETAVSDINAIKALIPRNCSLGTKQFCVGFSIDTKCNDLPLNISDIIPEDIADFVGDELHALQPLEGIMAEITPAHIQDFLILGLVLIFVIVIMFTLLIRGLLAFLKFYVRLGLCVAFNLLCLISFLIPTIFLYQAQSAIQNFEASIEVEKGDVASLCVGALCCAAFMLLVLIVSVFF